MFAVKLYRLAKYMEVKIDTKEKFHAITLPGPSLSATMTEELGDMFTSLPAK